MTFRIIDLRTGEDLCFDLRTGKICFFCFFANEPLDSDFLFFAALAGVACQKGRAIIRNYIIRTDISKLSICVPAKICVSPPTLPTSSSSQHSRPSISFYYRIQCTVICKLLGLKYIIIGNNGNNG